jgi:hypothetical protein
MKIGAGQSDQSHLRSINSEVAQAKTREAAGVAASTPGR